MYGYAAADPINKSDPFGLCPDSVKTEKGDCPGNLSTEEWDAVEGTYSCMSNEAAARTKQLLFSGNIKGASLADRRKAGRVSNKSPGTIDINRTSRSGNVFFLPILGPTLVHEGRHVVQLQGKSGWELYHFMVEFEDELEIDALRYEESNYTCER